MDSIGSAGLPAIARLDAYAGDRVGVRERIPPTGVADAYCTGVISIGVISIG
jgi:hypothetical protein